MTVVVAVKDRQKGWMIGSDSQWGYGSWAKGVLANKETNCKINEVHDCCGAFIGGTGTIRALQLVNQIPELIPYKVQYEDGELEFDYMVKEMFTKIHSSLLSYKTIQSDDETVPISILITYKDNGFIMCTDGTIMPLDKYGAIGCGDNVAMGSLKSTEGDPNTRNRIIMAIKAARDRSPGVGGDIVILSKDGREIIDS